MKFCLCFMVLLHQTRRNSVLKLFFETGSPGFYRKFYNETAKQAGVTSGYENLEESSQSQNYVAIKGKYSARRPRKKQQQDHMKLQLNISIHIGTEKLSSIRNGVICLWLDQTISHETTITHLGCPTTRVRLTNRFLT